MVRGAFLCSILHVSSFIMCCFCDDLHQKANVPKFEVNGHLDSTTCCVSQPFTGEVGVLWSCVSVLCSRIQLSFEDQ